MREIERKPTTPGHLLSTRNRCPVTGLPMNPESSKCNHFHFSHRRLGPQRWLVCPKLHKREWAAPASSKWALSPPHQGLPYPCPPRNQAFQPVWKLPPQRRPLSPNPQCKPTPTCGFCCLVVMQQEFPDGFMPRLVTKKAFSFYSRPGGHHSECRAWVPPSGGRSWLSFGTHLETSPNLSPRSHSVLTEPE